MGYTNVISMDGGYSGWKNAGVSARNDVSTDTRFSHEGNESMDISSAVATDISSSAAGAPSYVEDVEIVGHIIDSLILPKMLDEIMALGGRFEYREIRVGQRRNDPELSQLGDRDHARAPGTILTAIGRHGAVPLNQQDCRLVPADMDGAFPEGFYARPTSETRSGCGGAGSRSPSRKWTAVSSSTRQRTPLAAVPMIDVRVGDRIVVGHAGVRVFPERATAGRTVFEFMNSHVSTEKPKGVAIREIARRAMRSARGGRQDPRSSAARPSSTPAAATTSAAADSGRIHQRAVRRQRAGDARHRAGAVRHQPGRAPRRGDLAEAGHEHHLRAINRIRRLGGIRAAVEQGVLKSGIMYECVSNSVDFVLAGSIRDDGPLPEVITDMLDAQRQMREQIRGVTFCLMIATTLHSIAVGNLLPAWVKVVCVDINPSTVIKLSDRGIIPDGRPGDRRRAVFTLARARARREVGRSQAKRAARDQFTRI